jgi:predicted transcriptional regulator
MSTDLRSVHWREIRDFINPMRRLVHDKLGYLRHATAKEIAEYMATDKCSVRPRLTELLQLGLAETTGVRRNGEHEFAYVSLQTAEQRRRAEYEATHAGAQMDLLTT